MRTAAEEQERWLKIIMKADGDYLRAHPESNLFSYILARPNKAALAGPALAEWTRQEDEREARGARQGGVYYRPTAWTRLQTVVTALTKWREPAR